MNILRKNAAVEWKVPTIGSQGSRNGLSHSVLSPSFFAIRSRISLAALFVKVTQKIDLGSIWWLFIMKTTLSVMVWVFPDPAQALIRRGHSIAFTASCCSGLRFHMPGVYRKKWKSRDNSCNSLAFLYTLFIEYFLYSLFSTWILSNSSARVRESNF